MKKFAIKLLTAIEAVVILAVTLTGCGGKSAIEEVKKNDIFVFQQADAVWNDYLTADNDTLGPNGCGILSITNAVYYMTGRFMDPTEVSEWAYSIGGYLIYEGSGTIRAALYPFLEEKYGEAYGFTVPVGEKWSSISDEELKEHLKGDGVAIVHVKNHFMAVVEFDEENDAFLVLDSAANISRRGTTLSGDWMTEEQLHGSCSDYMNVDWYCLLSPADDWSGTEYSCNLNITSGAKSGTVSFCGGLTSLDHIEGETVTFRATPAHGYEIAEVKVNGEALELENDGDKESFSFVMPAKNTTVNVKFKKTDTISDYAVVDIGAPSFDVNQCIPVCAYTNRCDVWVGMFESDETDYTVANSVFYYPMIDRDGNTVEMNAMFQGGNISAYNDGGTFKVVLLTNGGKELAETVDVEVYGTLNGLPR